MILRNKAEERVASGIFDPTEEGHMERAVQAGAGVGAGSQDYLIETHRWYINSAERIGQRRATVNSLLLVGNAGLASYFSVVGPTLVENPIPNIVIPVIGLLVCLGWFLALKNFGQAAAAKAHVIRRLEEGLPATVFAEERKMVEQGSASVGPLAKIGNATPALFALMYVGITWYCQSGWGQQ
jgi:hypothetical protein